MPESNKDASVPVEIASGSHVRLVSRGRWEYAERTRATGVVVIVAVTDDRKMVLTEQYRTPVDARVIELPAGLAGDVKGAEDEGLVEAARRELYEETGYEAAAFDRLTAGPPSAGLVSEVVTLFAARDLVRAGAGGGDENEDITVHEVALDSVAEWLAEQERAGRMVDPKVYAGLYFAGVLEGD